MKDILPPGYEDPFVDYPSWHFSRFDSRPTPEETQRWQEFMEGLGFDDQMIEIRRLKIITQAAVDRANRPMKYADRLKSTISGDPTEGFVPVY